MENIIIYHNPRCSKSRQTLQLLDEQSSSFKVIEYLKEPFTKEELESIIDKLGLSPYELIRKNESEFKEKFKGKEMSSQDYIEAMLTFPKLIERPIVVKGNKAIIGRPPSNVLAIL